jgi:Transposase and inactivated derivatives
LRPQAEYFAIAPHGQPDHPGPDIVAAILGDILLGGYLLTWSHWRGKRKKMSKRTNQENANNPLGVFVGYLKYKLARIGAKIERISERYTSQTCPACGHRHKPGGRLYRCKCGFEGVRDEVGAVNILNKHAHDGELVPGRMIPQGKIKYLRPVTTRSVVVPLTPGKWLGMTQTTGSPCKGEVLGTAYAVV